VMSAAPDAGYAAMCLGCPLALICVGDSVSSIRQCTYCGEVYMCWQRGGFWAAMTSYLTFTCPCAWFQRHEECLMYIRVM
jgi:hypothetical protein